ncbi:MAG: acetylxylan esterase [Bacteroidia bacterium]|nr:acetylxylan esterase [Bacteroidia bacterium]
MKKLLLFVNLWLVFSNTLFSQVPNTISDEAMVPPYTVPELLISQGGKPIKNVKDWEKIRRPEVLALLEQEQYGKIPGDLKISEIKILDNDDQALGGIAIRKQVMLTFRMNGKELSVELLMYLPKEKKSFPTFLGYNFAGNQTVNRDTTIHFAKAWNGTVKERGSASENWPAEMIIKSGCGVAIMYYWDIAPDKNDYSTGVYPLFYSEGQTKPTDDEWGALSAWAWGLSRALDYLKNDKNVDGNHVFVIGHSRLGKAALWAGATDQRFAGVISNCSGCCGAALSKRVFGETIGFVNGRFPRWTCGNFKKYSDKEDSLPFDQHMVLSLIAPRPLYVASASEDSWADPKGEYLSACYASSVYALYGYKSGLNPEVVPQPDTPVSGIISHHIRSGKHDILEYDWKQYIQFAQSTIGNLLTKYKERK